MSKKMTVRAGSQNIGSKYECQAPFPKFVTKPKGLSDSEHAHYNEFPRDGNLDRSMGHTFQGYRGQETPLESTFLSVDVRALQRLQEWLGHLSNLRKNKLTESVRLRETRKALIDSRDRASQALSECLNMLRELSRWQDRYNSEKLDQLYEKTRSLYDVYGTLEAEYFDAEYAFTDMERFCNSKEWEYTMMEEQIHRHLADILSGQSQACFSQQSERSSSIDPDEWNFGDTQNPPGKKDGLVREYKAMLGELEMLREALQDLEIERAEVWDKQKTQHARGLKLNDSDQQFLNDFKKIYEDANQELQEAERETEEIRQRLFNTSSLEAPLRRRASSDGKDTIHKGRSKNSSIGKVELQHSSDPGLWSSQSDGGLDSLKHSFAAVRQRISDWILDNLNNNRLEKARHKALLSEQSLTDQEWWRLVRQHWDKGAEWEIDLQSQFETLRDSYTEYKHDSSNSKDRSSARVTVLESQGHSTNRSELEGQIDVLWPYMPESLSVEAVGRPLLLFPPTPPESVRDVKGLRRVRSTNSLRVGTPPAESLETTLRKSWSG